MVAVAAPADRQGDELPGGHDRKDAPIPCQRGSGGVESSTVSGGEVVVGTSSAACDDVVFGWWRL
jgi:hypothetical protein